MTLTDHPLTLGPIEAAVGELLPSIRARAGEIEAARSLPSDLVDALRASGCLRVLLPAGHGGAGATLAEAMDVFERVAIADASTGWLVALGASVWRDLASLPSDTFATVYGGRATVAGVFAPQGSSTRTADGYAVEGRWAFASGCTHADWLYANTIELVDGEPAFRTVLFDPSEVTIEDTWYVSGLRGTGSHHFHVSSLTVPAERTAATFTDPPCVEGTAVLLPPPSLFALAVASVALGTARGALDELLDLAAGKVPLMAESALAARPTFQQRLALADIELRAARCLAFDCAEELWAVAATGSDAPGELVARVRGAAAFAAATAARVVEAAYRGAGSTALLDECPLQRRLRDVNAITQHFLVKADTFVTVGAVLAGQPIDVPVF